MKTFKQFILESEKDWKDEELPAGAMEEHKAHHATLPGGASLEIDRYKQASGNYNHDLRYSKYHTGDTIEHYEHHRVAKLDAVTDRPMKTAFTAYRGFASFGDRVQHMKPGQTFTDHGYTGTTLSPAAAHYFSGETDSGQRHIAKIHIPAGTKGHYLPASSDEHPYEKELLLHRGTQFKVLKHTNVEDQSTWKTASGARIGGKKKMRVTHLEVVGQHPKEVVKGT